MRMRALCVALAVLVLAAGAALAWVLVRDEPAHEASVYDEEDGSYAVGWIPEEGAAPVEAAIDGSRLALAYDHRKLDEGLEAATSRMTGDFGTEFRDTFERVVRRDATREKTVAVALVKGAGLVSREGSRATALVFLNQVLLSSKGVAAGEEVRNVLQARVRISLERVDGDWLIDGIEPL